VNEEINDHFGPFMERHGGGRLVPLEKALLRSYLMSKLLGKFGEDEPSVQSQGGK
jgi:hypothetical protein